MLAIEMIRPIKQVSIDSFGPLCLPHSVNLWRPDGSGVRIHSEMHQIGERMEVGVLCFEHFISQSGDEVMLPVAPGFNQEVYACKLVVHQSGVAAESGILLRAKDESEITIVAGAFPLTIALAGIPDRSDKFESEYPMEDYERLPMRE